MARCKECIHYSVCGYVEFQDLECNQFIPTADVVKVKHGEWICLEAEIGLYSCSVCEHKIIRAECNYCPNCGAKMDGTPKEGEVQGE